MMFPPANRCLARRRTVDPYLVRMQTRSAHRSVPEVRLRAGDLSDLDGLVALEERVFAGDRVSRRGFRRFLSSPRAALIVAAEDGVLAGYALVLFRAGSVVARLYSLAVARDRHGATEGHRSGGDRPRAFHPATRGS